MSEPLTKLAVPKAYDIFLSYAHTDAEIAGEVAKALVEIGLTVFDVFAESAALWGADLYSSLGEIYPEQAHAAIVLLSEEYNRSSWCSRELDLLVRRAGELPDSGFILPVRLDDSPVPTLVANLLYLELRTTGATELAKLAKKRLEHWKEQGQEILARLTDDELMNRVATQRDTQAFDVLYKRLYPMVRRYASRVVHGPDADDLASEAMLKLWTTASRFDQNRGPLKLWLNTVIRNITVDYLRRQATPTHLGLFAEEPLETQSAEALVPSLELLHELNAAIGTLTESERQVINLLLAGTPLSDIAEILNVPVQAVRVRQHRAILKLRKKVGVLKNE
jgi:RNA polymerase sigma factor, sigma-70 family